MRYLIRTLDLMKCSIKTDASPLARRLAPRPVNYSMAFPTRTFYDDYADAILWLLDALTDTHRYPLLGHRVRPRLQQALDENFARWVRRAANHEIPALVLSVSRWQRHDRVPDVLLDRVEKGLSFNQGNAQELGNLTSPNFWDPVFSASILMQLMVTASLLDTAPAGSVKPVTGNRPDLWVAIDGREIGLEVTSRSHDFATRREIDHDNLPAVSVDYMRAEDDFRDLWDGHIAHKLPDYDGTYPIVLIVWDCNQLGDIGEFLESRLDGGRRTFRNLLDIHRPNCTPLSAILYLRYVDTPDLASCDGLSTGPMLTAAEAAGLRRLFTVNPAAQNGFLPQEEMP